MRSMLQQCPGYRVHARGIILGMSRYIYTRTPARRRIIRDGDYCPHDNFRGEHKHQRADVDRGSFE